jgi:hypothetical protein
MLFTGCASKKYENIAYLTSAQTDNLSVPQPTINIFKPKRKKYKNNKVLIFVHGGYWNSGDKEMYSIMGRNFAKRGITTIIAGYTLSPNANYDVMASQIAQIVKWTKENSATYNGNADEIYLTGHSAGAHLIALIGTNSKYLEDKNIIKGIILNDAAGLDMKSYLEKNPPTIVNDYIATWSTEPENWKEASPIYFIDAKTPKMMIYLGTKTYASIKTGTAKFVEKLNQYQPTVQPIMINKKHAPMVIQYFFPWSARYKEILNFMKESN